MLTYATPKGNPHLIPTGAPPTFAADGSDISDWLQAGRSFRRAATQAALTALTGMADRDLALVDAIPGAWFVYNGATAKWVMSGVPTFADAAARNAAITTPAAGMSAYLGTTPPVLTRHDGSGWRNASPAFPLARANTAVGTTGTVTGSGVLASITTTPLTMVVTAAVACKARVTMRFGAWVTGSGTGYSFGIKVTGATTITPGATGDPNVGMYVSPTAEAAPHTLEMMIVLDLNAGANTLEFVGMATGAGGVRNVQTICLTAEAVVEG